jgi:hypothetical protein
MSPTSMWLHTIDKNHWGKLLFDYLAVTVHSNGSLLELV